MQQADYLEALGIVQYRRRALQTQHPEKRADSPVGEVAELSRSTNPEQVKSFGGSSPAPSQKSSATTVDADSKVEAGTDELLSFDLLIWKTDKLLVWEFSPAGIRTFCSQTSPDQ